MEIICQQKSHLTRTLNGLGCDFAIGYFTK